MGENESPAWQYKSRTSISSRPSRMSRTSVSTRPSLGDDLAGRRRISRQSALPDTPRRTRTSSVRLSAAVASYDTHEHLRQPPAECVGTADDATMSRGLSTKIAAQIREACEQEPSEGYESIARRVVETYEIKQSYQRFRWNLLWLALVVGVSPLSLLVFVDASVALALCLGLQTLLTVAFLFACFHCWRWMWKMIGAVNTSWLDKAQVIGSDELAEIKHVVMICSYKEPLDLLRTTLRSLARSTMAGQIIAVVAFEAKTPDRETKIDALSAEFAEAFFAITCTTHTLLAGEIQGKCSNANFGMREGVRIHLERGDLVPGRTMCTTCDVDSVFHEKYFENLTYNFMTDPNRYDVVWQSPLVYNLGLDACSVFSRVTGVLRTLFMVGFLIPLDINTMSIFSTSLDMMVKGRFFHPGYQMDDVIYTLTCMRAIRKRVRIKLIEVPTISGPTSGATWAEDVDEWRVQARRWTIGAAEVFHYFFIKLIHREFEVLSGLSYGLVFTWYYAFILCIGQLNWICNLVVFNAVDVSHVAWGSFHVGRWTFEITVTGLALQYLTTYVTAFFMDLLVCNVLNIEERVSLLRRVAHFVSSQLVLIAYNVVEFLAILEIAWKGKKVCGHKPSNKDNLPSKKQNGQSGPTPCKVDAGSESGCPAAKSTIDEQKTDLGPGTATSV